jgi:hypothetical protein
LPVETIDDAGAWKRYKLHDYLSRKRRGGLRTWLNQWSLAHVGEEGEHRVEGREFPLRTGAVLDAGEQLGEDGQVQNEGCR